MLCCTIGATMIATGTASAASLHRAGTRRMIAAAALGLTVSGGGFIWHHLDHYAARAEANGRDIIAEIRAMPLCTGAPSSRAFSAS